jgi:hypothetical protein
MKKGLLSLLALALTVVGCQNYDDQFDELTSQITSLQSTVDGLTGVSSAITALQSTVAAISNAVGANASAIASGNSAAAAANAATQAGLATVSQTLANLQASLANVAQAGDLDAISSTLADVQADVRELLEANAVINQNVVINNSATLDYAETLIATGDDDPNVIVNGYVRINTTNLTDAEVTRANAIAAKLATILGNTGVSAPVGREALTVTGDDVITFTNLAFIDGDYVIDGADQDDAALRTVSGNLGVDHGGVAAAINYSQITSVGGDVAIDPTDAATATSIDFSGTDISGDIHHGAGSALNFPGATTINLGAASFNSLTAPKAGSIVSAITAVTTDVTINATKGGTIDLNDLETITGDFELTGATTTTFHADALESVSDLTVNSAGEAHFPALTTHGAIDITATTAAALTALVTSTAAIDLNNTPAVVLTNFVEAAHTLTWNIPVINLPNVNLEVPMSTTATNVTIKSFDVIGDVGTTVEKLVLTGQDVDLAGTSNVTNLTVTADGSGVDCTLAGAVLTDVSLSGTEINSFAATLVVLKNITLNDTATNTLNNGTGTVTQTVNLTGTIFSFTSDATTLAALNNSATFLDVAPPAATPITIDIEASALTSVDLSSMEKVAVIRFVNNTALTSLTAPSGASNLLTPGGGPTFTVTGNSITATYTAATAAFPGDGINPATPYEPACIESPSLASFKDYITAVSAVDTVTYVLDAKFGATVDGYGEAADADADQTHFPTAVANSTINNTQPGLSLIQATACN